MSETQRPRGFQGYHMHRHAEEDAELTHVEAGTPCGEYLRRYWQPVALSRELADLPLLVEILGEHLVLFRDKSDRVGLLHRHCAHRGASLEFGIVAERGIVCCYHGWHYDIDGTLLVAGSEPPDSPVCQHVVQGAYPAREHDGIVFAYLGPPDETPAFPVFDSQQQPDTAMVPFSLTTPCNWLQVYENTQDPAHVVHLHARSSGVQFGVASGVDQVIEYQDSPLGMINIQTRWLDGRMWTRTVDSILPNANQTGAIWEEAQECKYFQRSAMLRWMVPVNNTTTRTIGWRFSNERLDPRGQDNLEAVGIESIDFVGQTEGERSYEERQRQPGDFEVQVSQRPIAIHALENRATTDVGVTRLRRMIRSRIRAVAAGEPAAPMSTSEDSLVATYTQDTVVEWDGAAPPDVDVMRKQGRRVAEAVLASRDLSPARREAHVKAHATRNPA